jgi:hypothetical protein
MAKIIHLKGQHHILESSFTRNGITAIRSKDDSIYLNADIIYDLISVKSSISSKIARLDKRTIIRTRPFKNSSRLISWHAISTELSINEVIKLINE